MGGFRFQIGGKEYKTPGLSVWDLEQLQGLFGGLQRDEIKERGLEITTALITLLFDAGELLPEDLKDAPFPRQRKYVARLIGPEDLEGIGRELSEGMPPKMKEAMESLLGKAPAPAGAQ